ncbi:tyrosine-type recombinase/integrase [Natronorubrum texcoconense]|uniref:tyrosine-type recombinase/integrase n=1 Tax=Natronorubrum texcoconense TaxID=1095776 RepID=UPI000B7F2611|nr:tyrosine-type recombinase/integrase [Natronorubrum texcoconense]
MKPEQVEQLRDICLSGSVPTYFQDRNEAIVALLYDAGLRVGKVCALDVDHVELEAGTVYLANDTVRLLRRYLRDRWKDTDALFPTRSSDRLTTRSLQRLVEKPATEDDVRTHVAGGDIGDFKDVTLHTLRHSATYRIISLDDGCLKDVQLWLLHAN